jgi:hypothetical protein
MHRGLPYKKIRVGPDFIFEALSYTGRFAGWIYGKKGRILSDIVIWCFSSSLLYLWCANVSRNGRLDGSLLG